MNPFSDRSKKKKKKLCPIIHCHTHNLKSAAHSKVHLLFLWVSVAFWGGATADIAAVSSAEMTAGNLLRKEAN